MTATEHSWQFRPPDASGDAPQTIATYVVRRVVLPAASALRDTALLDTAAARVGRGVALQNESKATVAKVATSAGDAVELRWTTGRLRSATRLLPIPGGYCEATIIGAHTDEEIASYFASLLLRP